MLSANSPPLALLSSFQNLQPEELGHGGSLVEMSLIKYAILVIDTGDVTALSCNSRFMSDLVLTVMVVSYIEATSNSPAAMSSLCVASPPDLVLTT